LKIIRIFYFTAALAFIALVHDARAQFTSPLTPQSPITQLGSQKASAPPTSAESMTFESSIDPAEYHLGPGDVFECRFWTSGQTFYPLVSLDNMLLIPDLGAFDVRGKTLAQVRQDVMQKAAESFASRKQDTSRPPVTLALYQPRKIYVTVQGDVATPGVYPLSAATRADVAVDVANKLDPAMQPAQEPGSQQQMELDKLGKKRLQSVFGDREAEPPSNRYLTVAHEDGTTERIDLIRYNSMHDPKASPPLRQGDVIVVPFRDMMRASIGVYGAVQSPGEFEFVPGDSLSSAIKYAFGPSANADLHHVELTRIGKDDTISPPLVYDLTSIESHVAPDVSLTPNDRVIVRSIPEENSAAVVEVRGEVGEPGVYPIEDGHTTLFQVIHDAGGLSPKAYPAAGVIKRHGHEERLTAGLPEEVAQITRLEDLTVSDTASFQKQISMRPSDVVVDMYRLFVQDDLTADVKLEDGDEIVIPKRPTSVYVNGFVNNAGFVNYKEDAPLRYYIAESGGYAQGAETSETAVIKLRSKAWMDPSNTKIEPGDEIFVPKEPDFSEDYKLQRLTTWATIATTVISAISLYLLIKRP
jgi:protein involved in polysaccharide export with SLBB domain